MAKKAIVNVVEINDNVVLGINSFIVENEKDRQKISEKAEKLFVKFALQNGMKKADTESYLDDGIFEGNNGYSVCISWSN